MNYSYTAHFLANCSVLLILILMKRNWTTAVKLEVAWRLHCWLESCKLENKSRPCPSALFHAYRHRHFVPTKNKKLGPVHFQRLTVVLLLDSIFTQSTAIRFVHKKYMNLQQVNSLSGNQTLVSQTSQTFLSSLAESLWAPLLYQ